MMIHPPTSRPTRRIIALNATLVVVLGTAISVALGAPGNPDPSSHAPISRSPGASYTITIPTPTIIDR